MAGKITRNLLEFTRSTTGNQQGDLTSYVAVYNKLTYVLNGATYVLDGKTDTGAGQVTLSKNGNVIATLKLTPGKAPEMTGTVDPF